MLDLQGTKVVMAITPYTASAAGVVTSASIDTLGYEELNLCYAITTHASNPLGGLTIQQSDADDTNYANVTGYVAGTDFTITDVKPGTTVGKLAGVFNIDLRGKKRYFRTQVTNGAVAGGVACIATLARGVAAPISAANVNAGVIVNPS